MDDITRRVSALLREVAEVHHTVYRITDGEDEDWASWYADWLLRLSELPDLLGQRPVRSALTYHLVVELVACARIYEETAPREPWDQWYAERLTVRFGAGVA